MKNFQKEEHSQPNPESWSGAESQLISQCNDDAECSEEAHQLDRRWMFIIQE